MTPEETAARIARLQMGDYQFGHAGRHRGRCGEGLHHHHDSFCTEPTDAELTAAGLTREEYNDRRRSRA